MITMVYRQVVEVKAETGRRRAVIDAEKLAQAAKIQYEQKSLVKESEKTDRRDRCRNLLGQRTCTC